jgi:hypothetical protein|nr:MAG TPA: hypothetical protein [Inoviridae sp.]
MDLLTLVRLFLILGNTCYILAILTFIKRHLPKVQIKEKKKDTGGKEDGRKDE